MPNDRYRDAALGAVLATVAMVGHAAGEPSQRPAQESAPWQRYEDGAARPAQAHFKAYRFQSGETLEDLRLHYATLDEPHRGAAGEIDNAVLVLHWTAALLSPSFVSALYGPGRPLDARRYYLIFPDHVGHGRSSKPSDGLRAGFPHYNYGDLVDLQHRLVTETLGIKHLHAILGMSMGSMIAWQWAETYPDMMDGVCRSYVCRSRFPGETYCGGAWSARRSA